MNCLRCNYCNKEGSKFCENCGYELNTASKNTINNKKKKSSGCLTFIIKFVLVLFIIAIIIIGILKIVELYQNKKYDDFIKKNVIVDKSFDNTMSDVEKQEDWNNDGISNEDALKYGLNPSSKDSDGDGVSDYDELYMYHSDPLKYSTSGDIYSDGYKVRLGYQLDNVYETKKTFTTSNSDIDVEVDDARDMNYYYKEYNGTVPGGYLLGYKPFRIYSFKGKVTLSIENPNNFNVISYSTTNKKTTKIKSKVNDGKLVFNIDSDEPILIVYKNSIVKKMDATLFQSINSNYSNNVENEYYVVAFPLVSVLFGQPVYVMEINNNMPDEINQALEDDLNLKADGKFKVKHSFIHEILVKIFDFFFGKVESNLLGSTNDKSSFIDYIFTYRHVYSKDELYYYLFGKSDSNNNNNNNSNSNSNDSNKEVIEVLNKYDEKYNNMNCKYCADSGFNVNVNAFSFSNLFTTKTDGVCAGFAHITTNVYNEGKLKKSINNKYDLTNDYYDSIWSKNLFNYKTDKYLTPYADDIYHNEDTLDSATADYPDGEVIRALEYHWGNFNSTTRFKKFGVSWNRAFENISYIDKDTVDNLLERFKNGKIVTATFIKDGAQHAVNVYKMVEDVNDSDIIYIKVYDNNMPSDKMWFSRKNGVQKEYADTTIKLKRVYEDGFFGVKEKYLFEYNPVNSSSYYYGNINGGFDGILFFDENYNVL